MWVQIFDVSDYRGSTVCVCVCVYIYIYIHVTSYGCETWYVTVSGEHRRGVSENGVLQKVFGPRR